MSNNLLPSPAPPLSKKPRSKPHEASQTKIRKNLSSHNLKQAHAHLLRSRLPLHHPSISALAASFLCSSRRSCLLPLFTSAVRSFSKTPAALFLYLFMTRLAVPPDNLTFPFLLNSCAAVADFRGGAEIHSRSFKTGFSSQLHVGNALIDLYGKCSEPDLARQLFDEMSHRDLVSFNTLLVSHARLGHDIGFAETIFRMVLPSHRNTITWNAMIIGYANAGDLCSARAFFDDMKAVRNSTSWTVMILGYSKLGFWDEARKLFDAMPEKNLVAWTIMITGYAQSGRPSEALALFREMDGGRKIQPDAATMVGVISSAAQMGGADLANWVGNYVDSLGGIERNKRLLTALVDMHAKCGNVEEACKVFEEISSPDSVSFAALINGLAHHGHGVKALELFDKMVLSAIPPDYITFVGVLSACSHMGLVDKALELWDGMVGLYGVERGPEHYACLVDVLGRAGRLEEAYKMAKEMESGPHAGTMGALLAACRTYGNVKIAEAVSEVLFELEPKNTGNYVLLWSIYADRGWWRDAARVRKKMRSIEANKLPGSSWFQNDVVVKEEGARTMHEIELITELQQAT